MYLPTCTTLGSFSAWLLPRLVEEKLPSLHCHESALLFPQSLRWPVSKAIGKLEAFACIIRWLESVSTSCCAVYASLHVMAP